ncbi:hypothetical protein AAMO2058_001754300, partial [Amorphochlora amoebiformis]
MTSRPLFLVVALGSAMGMAIGDLGEKPPIDPIFDCAWRSEAFLYAQYIQPWLSVDPNKLSLLHSSLKLATLCNQTLPPAADNLNLEKNREKKEEYVGSWAAGVLEEGEGCDVFVEAYEGRGGGGHGRAIGMPRVESVTEGVEMTRLCEQNSVKRIILLPGTHYLNQTVNLNQGDSNIRIVGQKGAVISGGVPLDSLKWKKVSDMDGVYVTSINAHLPNGITGLMVNGKRAIRARYPNAVPETSMFPEGYILNSTKWGMPKYKGKPCDPNDFCGQSKTIVQEATDAWHGMWTNFSMGYGGSCDRFDPPQSVCSIFGSDLLPNYPYKNIKGAVIHTWRLYHWYSWMFEIGDVVTGTTYPTWNINIGRSDVWGQLPAPKVSIGDVTYLGEFDSSDACWKACNESESCKSWTWFHLESDPEYQKQCYKISSFAWSDQPDNTTTSGRAPYTTSDEFVFSRGGNQGGEGADEAAEWWIENVLEELDAENEFYYDQQQKNLYYKPSVGQEPPSMMVATSLAVFFNISGTQHNPVRNISFVNISFTDGRATYLEAHGSPSGGDWALQ